MFHDWLRGRYLAGRSSAPSAAPWLLQWGEVGATEALPSLNGDAGAAVVWGMNDTAVGLAGAVCGWGASGMDEVMN